MEFSSLRVVCNPVYGIEQLRDRFAGGFGRVMIQTLCLGLGESEGKQCASIRGYCGA